MPECQIKEILRPETSNELHLIAQASQKQSNWLACQHHKYNIRFQTLTDSLALGFNGFT